MSYLSGIRVQKIANLLLLTKIISFVKNFFAKNILKKVQKRIDESECQI